MDDTVGADTTLQVSLTTVNGIPKRGKLHVGVSSAWNDGTDASKVDYFSSITCNSFKVKEVGKSEETKSPGTYVCSFFGATLGQAARVEVDGGFKLEDVAAGTEIKINIVGFRNPI